MTEFARVTPDFSVAAQISADDIAAAAAAGVKTIICNRPDGEAPDQLAAADARAAAEAAGLVFVHIPIAGMPPPREAGAAMARALAETAGPHLAYCRSGTRSITAWAMAQAQGGAPADDVIATAAAAGYDLRPHRGAIAPPQ